MEYEIYCDESHPEVLTSANPAARHLLIGGLWLPADQRTEIKRRITELRRRHNTWGEIKWRKVSPSRLAFYLELVDLFFEFGDANSGMRFRVVVVDKNRLNPQLHRGDPELVFYKFYYQLVHHWIWVGNAYRIFCDGKSSTDPSRLKVLGRCLARANRSADVKSIQSLPSREVALIQLCDLLLGAASNKLNQLPVGDAGRAVVRRIEDGIGREIAPTGIGEAKFNVFKMNFGRDNAAVAI